MPDWFEVMYRTAMAVVILFLITKLLGKRQVSQLSLFEYITGISIGNIIGYISLDLDNQWYHGLVALAVWTCISVGIEFVTLHSRKVRDFVDGKARVLVKDGQVFKNSLKKERITADEFMEQLRKKNVYRMADVEFAVMEPSGEINVMMKKDYQPLNANLLGWKLGKEKPGSTVIIDGRLMLDMVDKAGYDKAWIEHELKRRKVDIKDVFIGQIDSEGQLLLYSGTERILEEAKTQKPSDRILQLSEQFASELRLMEKLARNEEEREAYQLALDRLEAANLSRGGSLLK